jgi:hypothetical protein
MVATAGLGVDLSPIRSPSLVPDQSIDFERLALIGQGDDKVIRQLLEAFDLQVEVLTARMASEAPNRAAARAHTLALSARTIGAWKVANCAADFERIALGPQPIILGPATSRLVVAIADTHGTISSFLSGTG